MGGNMEFNENHEYGEEYYKSDIPLEVLGGLELARRRIPSEFFSKVQIRKKKKTNFDRDRPDLFAWYYSPNNALGYHGNDGEWIEKDNFYVWGKHVHQES